MTVMFKVLMTVLLTLALTFSDVIASDTSNIPDLDTDQITKLELVIKQHKDEAAKSNFNVGLFDLAINRISLYNELKKVNDQFFRAASHGTTNVVAGKMCKSMPEETISSYYIPIMRKELDQFTSSEFVKSLPKNAVSKLGLLKYISQETTLSDSFARIFSDKSGADEVERFEVGHVIIKAAYDKDTVHILILAPSVLDSLDVGCSYGTDFRDTFIGMSQDLQNWIAIKAAENQPFVDALKDFSPKYGSLSIQQLAAKGYELFQNGGMQMYRRTLGTSTCESNNCNLI
jgi:hypothetical protein